MNNRFNQTVTNTQLETSKSLINIIAELDLLVPVDGTCIECATGKYRFQFHMSVVEKYAGQIRELMSESPCYCGGYLWLVSIPPKPNKLDNMIEEKTPC